MLKLRVRILGNILSAPDPTFVGNAMKEIIQEMLDNDCSNRRFTQYIKCVKSDIFFQMRLKHSRREFNNLTEALKIIQEGFNIEKTINQ